MHETGKFETSGAQPPEGIELVLHDITTPKDAVTNANCAERSLTPLKEERDPYQVTSVCYTCSHKLRVTVSSTPAGVRKLQEALLLGLYFYCPGCARDVRR